MSELMQHPFVQFDANLTTNYLSQLAAHFRESQQLNDKIIDSFRTSLREASKRDAGFNEPFSGSMLARLFEQDEPYLQALVSGFGKSHIFCNLLRYSLKAYHGDLRTSIEQLVGTCLGKAKLFFNRSFYLYENQRCESRFLASSIFLQMSEQAAQLVSFLDLKSSRYFYVNPAPVTNDDRLDNYYKFLQSAFDLNPTRPDPLQFFSDNAYIQELSDHIRGFLRGFLQAFEALKPTVENQKRIQILLQCDDLQAEAQRLTSLNLPAHADLGFLEGRRQQWSYSLMNLSNLFEKLTTLLEEALQLRNIQPVNTGSVIIPESYKRSVVLKLLQQGHNASDAIAASESMQDYCMKNEVTPTGIVPAELANIHPLLNEQTLIILKEIEEDQRLAHKSGSEKQFVLERSRELLQAIQSKTPFLALIFSLVFGGCGLKTKPQSNIEDLRPSLPYENVAAEPPTSKQAADQGEPVSKDKKRLDGKD